MWWKIIGVFIGVSYPRASIGFLTPGFLLVFFCDSSECICSEHREKSIWRVQLKWGHHFFFWHSNMTCIDAHWLHVDVVYRRNITRLLFIMQLSVFRVLFLFCCSVRHQQTRVDKTRVKNFRIIKLIRWWFWSLLSALRNWKNNFKKPPMLVLTQWANILEIREVALGSQTLTELWFTLPWPTD